MQCVRPHHFGEERDERSQLPFGVHGRRLSPERRSSCYLVSLRVASERAALEDVETEIVLAQRDIRLLQTEIGTRGRLAQLERWNVKVLALSAPSADQFVADGFTLARLTAARAQAGGRSAGGLCVGAVGAGAERAQAGGRERNRRRRG